MHAVVTEIFADRTTREGCQELHGCGVGGGCRNDHRIFQRPVFFQHLDKLGNGGALLADGDIDAIELGLLIRPLIDRLLVEDGVKRHRRLARLAVADDQLALSAPDRDERVNGLEAGLHRLMNGAAGNDPGRLDVNALALAGDNRSLAIDRIAERVNHAAKQPLADRHVNDGTGALHRIAFADLAVSPEDHAADIVAFKIERHALDAAGKFHHLAGLDVIQAIDARDAIANRQHATDLGNLGGLAEIADLFFEDGSDFSGANVHQRTSFNAILSCDNLVLREVSIMRLPTLTVSPPIRDGSILVLRVTSLPSAWLMATLRALARASFNGSAKTTSATVVPRFCASRARNDAMALSTIKRRRLRARSLRKFPASAPMPNLGRSACRAASCASLEKSGDVTSLCRSLLSCRARANISSSPSVASLAWADSASSNRARA